MKSWNVFKITFCNNFSEKIRGAFIYNTLYITVYVSTFTQPGGGGEGTDLERGYGDVQPWRPSFHASPVVCKGPISSKRVSSQDPLFIEHLAHKPSNFEIFSSQAPKFGNFQFTSPPFQRQISVRKPHTSEIWAANPYLKKVAVSAPLGFHNWSRDVTFQKILWFQDILQQMSGKITLPPPRAPSEKKFLLCPCIWLLWCEKLIIIVM